MELAQRRENMRRFFANLGEIRRFFHFHLRRIFSKSYLVTAGYHSTGPLTYLLTASAIGLAMTLSTLYTTSYVVTIDGVNMAVVENRQVVQLAIAEVEAQGRSILGQNFTVESDVEYQFGLHLFSELTDSSGVEHYLYTQLEEVGQALLRYEVRLEGKKIAVLQQESQLELVLEQILDSYRTENTVSAEFVESVTIHPVYEGEFTSVYSLKEILTENTTGETNYVVEAGDTFNAIAFRNDMSTTELQNLNPDVEANRLFVGDLLHVKRVIPLLSVTTVNQERYLESIPCPLEQVNDNSSYIGTNKLISQGVEGEAEVESYITYLNGVAVEEEILSTTVLREPTPTINSVGTLERPKTASVGSFIWPTSGRISSYFGGRTLYGSYDYHSGLDIATNYGTAVVAADGGTVSFSGWRSSYGNLVIITHDNGWQTYYAHNSSLLVSAGQKVYRGQTIARVGSTGNSSGNPKQFQCIM